MQTDDPIVTFFGYEHLPPMLQQISKPFGDLARSLVAMAPACEERHVALRKLLEAKDCAVRAYLCVPRPGMNVPGEPAKGSGNG